MSERVNLSSEEVCRLSGATYRQLNYWRSEHLISPSLSTVHGSGSKARWDADDLSKVKALVVLRDLGMELPLAAAVCEGGPEAFRALRDRISEAERLWLGKAVAAA